jgi:microcin C transport system substrate-binding protein
MYEPPVTDGPGRSLRDNLRRAQALLKEAGWEYRDGALRNAAGERMVLEYLDSRESGVRTLTPWIRNLEKLGIELRFSPVDFALYQQRLDKFEFDIMTINFQGTHNPGQQMLEIFGSKAADVEGGGNFFGVKNPAVDALLAKLTAASTKEQLLPACKALDRVIMYNHYLIPQWSLTSHRMVYNAWRLAFQAPMPGYNGAEEWVMYYWWSRGDAQAR